MADNTVKVSFIGDTSSLKKAVDDSDGHLARLGSSIAGFAKAAAVGVAAAGVGLAVFAKSAVSAASNLSESQSKVGVVFGEQAKDIESWASRSATAFGQSKQSALEAVGTYGNLFQAFGVGRAKSADMSKSLVELAADMASFNNTSVDDALLALQSGLSGETEPLKRYGVALSDVRLKDEAVRLGLIKTTKEALDPAAKAQASYSLIMRDTALAQGDFGRTSDGLANKTRILQARFSDIQAEIGTKLLPIATRLAGFILDKVIPAFSFLGEMVSLAFYNIVTSFRTGEETTDGFQLRMQQFGIVLRSVFEWMRDTIPPIVEAVFGWLRDNVPPILSEIGRIAGDVFEQRLVPAFQAVADVVMNQLWPAIQTTFDFLNEHREIVVGIAVAIGVGLVAAFVSWAAAAAAAAAATIAATAPVIAIGVAIAALVAGVIYAYQHWGWFRDAVDAVARFLKNDLLPALRAIAEFIIKDVIPVLADIIGWFINIGVEVVKLAVKVGGAIADIIQFFVNVGIAVYNFAENFVKFVAGMGQQLAEWVLKVWEKGGEIIQWFRDLPGEITRAVGNLLSLLVQAGKDVIQGLWNGISNAWEGIKDKVADIGHKVKDAISGALKILSPSQVMYDVGQYTIEGLQLGMEDAAPGLYSMSEKIGLGVGDSLSAGLGTGLDGAIETVQSKADALAAIFSKLGQMGGQFGDLPLNLDIQKLAAGFASGGGTFVDADARMRDALQKGLISTIDAPAVTAALVKMFVDQYNKTKNQAWLFGLDSYIKWVDDPANPGQRKVASVYDGNHGGGIVGADTPMSLSRPNGLRGDEYLRVLQKGEGVFTPGQMAALGGQVINIYIGKVNANSDGAVSNMAATMSRELAVALRGSVA